MAKEAELKSEVHKYLKKMMELGQLYYDRLNSGKILALYGGKKRAIWLCRPGTADYFVLQDGSIYFLELKAGSTKKKRTEDQSEFAGQVMRHGARYFVIEDMVALRSIFDVPLQGSQLTF